MLNDRGSNFGKKNYSQVDTIFGGFLYSYLNDSKKHITLTKIMPNRYSSLKENKAERFWIPSHNDHALCDESECKVQETIEVLITEN